MRQLLETWQDGLLLLALFGLAAAYLLLGGVA